jgi:two-component system chemotaxis response regulator CheB
MRQAGAHTVAQDQASCVVFGMPGAAIELEAAEQVQPLNRIARALLELVGR